MSKKYFLFTLGCQMNIYDSQRLVKTLSQIGFKPASEKEAGLVIVNACSVRQSAVDRIWGKIKKWQANKKKIFITGCVLPADKKKFAQKGIKFFQLKNLLSIKDINEYFNNYSNILQNIGIMSKDIVGEISYIPIMTGCDNFCSYCAVPLTRGREVSKPFDEIVSDIKKALENGAKDILLLGQNVNSYQYGFAKLLLGID
ncbi:MAG: radical SAM protein, partial [Patescibacteria group bacterium]